MTEDGMRIEREPADSCWLVFYLRGRETNPDAQQGVTCFSKDFVDIFSRERTYEPVHALGEGGGVIVYHGVEEGFFFGGIFESAVDEAVGAEEVMEGHCCGESSGSLSVDCVEARVDVSSCLVRSRTKILRCEFIEIGHL
jgi:hypothetical protein